ncbi:hypothetical protein ACGFMM_16000 [Streptomyces sp. NPDC048604]|uniref:hypothetical protein n=1 Tax=Streptomyces sp. NPDC048604 TaxID=3365578 RepID=UPI00371443C2
MPRSHVVRAVLVTFVSALMALSAACGAGGAGSEGRRGPGSGGRPEHGADESWFTTAGVTPEDPEVLLRELRAGRTPRSLGLVRSGAAAGATYVYVNWAWTLWPPGLRPVGVALTRVRVTDSTVAVGPVRRYGRVSDLSLRVGVEGGAARTATLRAWERAPHTFPAGAPQPRRGFRFQYVVPGEPDMAPLDVPVARAGAHRP